MIKNCFHLVLGILVGASLCLPNLVQAQGPAIITQELCWTTPTEVDSSIVGYFIFSSRDDTPLLVSHLNAEGQTVNVSGGSLKIGECCCRSTVVNPLDTIYSINNTLFVVTGGDTLSTVISNADRSTFVYKLALGEVYNLPQDTIDKYEHLVIIAASNSTLGDTAVVNFPSIPSTLRYAGKRIFVYAEENVADNEFVVVVTAPQEDGGSTLGSSLRRQDCTAPNTMSYTNDTVSVQAQAVHRLLEYTTIPGKEFGFYFRECKGGGAGTGGSPVDTVYTFNDTLYVVSGTDTLTTPILNIYTTNGTTNSALRTVIVQSSNSELSGMIIRNAAGTIALQIIARDDAAQGYGQLRSSNGAAIAWVRSTGGRKNELSVFHSGNQTTSIQSLPDSILLDNGEVYMTKVPVDTSAFQLLIQADGRVVKGADSGGSTSFDSDRPILRVPTVGTNIGGTSVNQWLEWWYFTPPTISLAQAPTTPTVIEVGTVQAYTYNSTTTNTGGATLSNGEIFRVSPANTFLNFGAATSGGPVDITYSPNQAQSGQAGGHFYQFRATQDWTFGSESGTATSSTRTIQAVYPILYGMAADTATVFADAYGELTKLVETEGNKTVSLTGSGLIFYAFPASWADTNLSSIIDPNGFNVTASFTRIATRNVTSTGLTNNWTNVPYVFYFLNTGATTTSASNYTFNR